jgi:uncharacterized protein YcnI
VQSFSKLSLAAGAGILLALAVPLSASAHVTVTPGAAVAGSYTLLTVKVPNESATAATNRLELSIPTATPFSSVSYVPVPGWNTKLIRTTLPTPVTVNDNEVTEAVTSVVWTAQAGSEIVAGQLQTFQLSVGPVPDTGSILLSAEQTYTDGTVVKWADTAEGAEHPAPVLYINDTAPASAAHGGAAVSADSPDAGSGASDDIVARMMGLGGLVLGAVAVVVAIAGARRKPAAS